MHMHVGPFDIASNSIREKILQVQMFPKINVALTHVIFSRPRP